MVLQRKCRFDIESDNVRVQFHEMIWHCYAGDDFEWLDPIVSAAKVCTFFYYIL